MTVRTVGSSSSPPASARRRPFSIRIFVGTQEEVRQKNRPLQQQPPCQLATAAGTVGRSASVEEMHDHAKQEAATSNTPSMSILLGVLSGVVSQWSLRHVVEPLSLSSQLLIMFGGTVLFLGWASRFLLHHTRREEGVYFGSALSGIIWYGLLLQKKQKVLMCHGGLWLVCMACWWGIIVRSNQSQAGNDKLR